MHISRHPLAVLVAVAGLAAAAPAANAAPDKTISPATPTVTWTSAVGNGLNLTWLVNTGPAKGTCGTDLQNFCDVTLVHLVADHLAEGSQLKFRLDGFGPASDFDLRVYASDADKTYGAKTIASPTGDVTTTSPAGGNDPRATSAGDYETVITDVSGLIDPDTGAVDAYYLVMIPYFMVANDKYTGTVTLIQPAA